MHTVQLIALAASFGCAIYGILKGNITALGISLMCLVLVEALEILPAK
jgi:hypothetical protein